MSRFYAFRQWEFARYRVRSPEDEDRTIDLAEADGWEYIATVNERSGDFVVLKRKDGVTKRNPRFPVWQWRGMREDEGRIDSASGIDRSAKMTDAEKLGKRGRSRGKR